MWERKGEETVQHMCRVEIASPSSHKSKLQQVKAHLNNIDMENTKQAPSKTKQSPLRFPTLHSPSKCPLSTTGKDVLGGDMSRV